MIQFEVSQTDSIAARNLQFSHRKLTTIEIINAASVSSVDFGTMGAKKP
jgi:hypothetical protein